jgi:FtsP/CotA-like multicopper oxidase with cupredoxin domain
VALQDFALDGAGQVVEPTLMQRTQGREASLVTVNGLYNPTIPIAAGGWVRLRILNASVSKFYRLRLEEYPLTIVATDGGLIAAPVEADELLVVPGQRYDIFVRGRAAGGSYRLLNLPYDRFGAMLGGMGSRPTIEPRHWPPLNTPALPMEPGPFLIVWPTPA